MTEDNREYTKEDQIKAAYALNLCTVSVSQIVDYNDEYILEQEYEAILNNLNLEQMPKDEALLNILVKLLNVITFFRISKVKKNQIEKKYQRRIKNAIWSAVPNIGVIVAGNPLTVGLSLATQVGIGYMNYRREKANALADKDDSEIELEITAMEQFNALRRELFTTAWRLADEYKFPDSYRLTERQIEQYDQILMDTDEIRKYERLTSIEDRFEAYLPFWYYMGHTAKYISEDKNNGLEQEVRAYYREEAKKHFEKYYKLNSFNLLREDELTASFALEYIDLLMLESNPDENKISDLIKIAVSMAGNAEDILEICAVTYLKLGDTLSAEELLRNLINEDYNTETNAKLLSRIYVSEYLKGANPLARVNYKILASRVACTWLFPMPDNKTENLALQDKQLQDKYVDEQRIYLQKEYSDAITQFIKKYIILFNRTIPVPGGDESDEYFIDTEEALKRRRQDVYDALNSDMGGDYMEMIRESGFRFRYVELINDMLDALDKLRIFKDNDSKEYMILLIRKNIAEVSGELKDIQEDLNNHVFTIDDYDKLQENYSFEKLTKEFFDYLMDCFSKQILSVSSLDRLDDYELDIIQFCKDQGIPEINTNPDQVVDKLENTEYGEYIPVDVIGKNEKDERLGKKIVDQMMKAIRSSATTIIIDPARTELLLKGDDKFDRYFKNVRLSGDAFRTRTLAIIDDKSFADADLFITSNGIVPVKHGRVGTLYSYDRIEYKGNSIQLGWPDEYSNRSIDIGELYSLIEKLEKIRYSYERA